MVATGNQSGQRLGTRWRRYHLWHLRQRADGSGVRADYSTRDRDPTASEYACAYPDNQSAGKHPDSNQSSTDQHCAYQFATAYRNTTARKAANGPIVTVINAVVTLSAIGWYTSFAIAGCIRIGWSGYVDIESHGYSRLSKFKL